MSPRKLTERQKDILTFRANGHSSSQWIAAELGISECTVRTHTVSILKKLQARNVAHAVYIALLSLQISPEDVLPAPLQVQEPVDTTPCEREK